jgi:hypothetical protein
MTSPEHDRLERLERQVSYLLQHLGIDPDQAAGVSAAGGSAAGGSTFGEPSDVFGSTVPGPGYGSSGFGPGPADSARNLPPEFYNALNRGKMIEAIKIYREVMGVGLREAKSAVESIAGRP